MVKAVGRPWAVVVAVSLLGIATPARALLRSEAHEEVLRGLESPEEAFEEWAAQHGKVYASGEERAERLAVWLDNLGYIESYNTRTTSHWLGLGPFTDLTEEEFSDRQNGDMEPEDLEAMGNEKYLSEDNLPESVDWVARGAVRPPQAQGRCGSCWAFAAVSVIESVNQIYTGELLDLSEQELVDCDETDGGCRGGLPPRSMLWVQYNGGIDVESDYPYRPKSPTPGMCDLLKEGDKEVSIDEVITGPKENSMQMHAAVAQQPIAVAVGVSKDWQHYKGGVFDGICSDKPNHSVVAVGYGSYTAEGSDVSQDYWMVKNSWSTRWGDGGYIRMARSKEDGPGLCGIQKRPSYPVKTTPNPTPRHYIPSDFDPDAPRDVCAYHAICTGGSTCCCSMAEYGACMKWTCCVKSTCDTENLVCVANDDRIPGATIEVTPVNPLQQGRAHGGSNVDVDTIQQL